MLTSIQKDTNEILKKVDELAKDKFKLHKELEKAGLQRLLVSLRSMEGDHQTKIRKIIQDEINWWKSSGDDYRWKPRGGKSKRNKKRGVVARFESSQDGDGQKSTRTVHATAWDGSENEDDGDQAQGKAPRDKSQSDEFGDWLFQTKQYNDWIKYPQGLLWLYGSAGCGKSTLCISIINNLKEAFKMTKTKIFASWHFRVENDETKKLNVMLASLLRQLATQLGGFPDDEIHTAFQGFQTEGELTTDIKDLLNHMHKFIQMADKDIFLVFDGVDQVPDRQDRRGNDPKLLEIIKTLALTGHPNLHLLVVSRDEKDIRSYFKNSDIKDMLDFVNVTQHLGNTLEGLIDKKLDGETMTAILKGDQALKDKIRARLIPEHEARNVLWASSVLRQVLDCGEASDIEPALLKIPDTINTRYQAVLNKVSDKDKDRMKRILLWLRWSERPLSQAELVAIAGLHTIATLTKLCSRVLIETADVKHEKNLAGQSRSEVLRFTHFSVRDYLDDVPLWVTRDSPRTSKEPDAASKLGKISRFVARPSDDVHLQLTRGCLAVLLNCMASPRNRATSTIPPGSDAGRQVFPDSDDTHDDDDTSDGGSDSNKDVSDPSSDGHVDSSSEDDGRSISIASSGATGGGCVEWPARRYAAEHWFSHYAKIDREKVSNELAGLENEICSQLLVDASRMRFWLRTHNPDGGHEEMGKAVPSPVYFAVKLQLGGIFKRIMAQIEQLTPEDAQRRAQLLDQPGVDGTALQLAAHKGYTEILEDLIKHKADVNSKRGLNGTALYASAVYGNRDAVDKLLQAGAKLNVEDHGDLGGPLHVAAFLGHDAVVELLLEQVGLDINHSAGPFGTALQAAAATRQLKIVRMLLERQAKPDIIDGCLGTAAQAALTHDDGLSAMGDRVIRELETEKAQFLERPRFWTLAFESATLKSVQKLYWIYLGRDSPVARAYTELLRGVGPVLPPLAAEKLRDRQKLLASVIPQWTLPDAQSFDDLYPLIAMPPSARVPLLDQLIAIRRVTPQRKLRIEDLYDVEFLQKASFWAGVNFILGKLPHLVEDCLEWLFLRYDDRTHRRLGMEEADEAPHPVSHFRWTSYRIVTDQDEQLGHGSGSSELRAMLSFMDRSDLDTIDFAQQRPRGEQLIPPHADPTGPGSSKRESIMEEKLPATALGPLWVTSDVLELAEYLVECGYRCARYQDAAGDSNDMVYRKHVEDLTSELFSAVVRLALVLDREVDEEKYGMEFNGLAVPVGMLIEVRLPRIKKLDAICMRGPNYLGGIKGVAETGCGLEAHMKRMTARIVDQLGQAIGDRMASDIQRSIREEVAGAMEEMRKDMGQQVRDEVQRQLAEARPASSGGFFGQQWMGGR
ncbi:hypothetical protein F5Y17DRAFT_238009 [Xylariaceae sp. FL0594]|nr:hypothetical protein F5Y17DRAFT_238009 [Xylariaceae sp. FL0594]